MHGPPDARRAARKLSWPPADDPAWCAAS